MAIIKNKDVIQSYIMSTAKYDYSVYEKRILYRLVEMAQTLLEGKTLNKGFSIEKTLFDDRVITMPITAFLVDEKDQNHARVKEALMRLRNKTFEYDDGTTWKLIGVIEKPRFDVSGLAKFELQTEVFEAILNFSKGYRKYELKTAMTLTSEYSMRFYELLSNQKTPLSYSINQLKEMFQLENKYKQVNDFTKRVIDTAKAELDAKSPYSFTYESIKYGRKITGFTFFPVYQPEHRDQELEKAELQKQISPAWDLIQPVRQYLKHQFEFTTAEIKQHIELFKQAQNELEDIMLFMSKVKARANRAGNPKGYLINAMRKELKQQA